MIIIEDNTGVNTIKIPCNYAKNSSNTYSLTLIHTVNKTEETFTVTDTTPSSNFYTFSVNFSTLPAGEYEFELDLGLVLTGLGLLRINKSAIQRTYFNENITYKSYEG